MRRWLTLAVAAAAFLAFVPTLWADFIVTVDDGMNVVGNPRVHGITPKNIVAWFEPHGGHFHPLTWMSFAIDHTIWGLDPFGYHLTNLLLHAVCAVLCMRVLLALLPDSTPACIAAAIGAAWFAVHPLRVESVAWVTERRDVLSGVFWVATVLFWIRSRRNASTARRDFALAIVAYGCSLGSKAWGITMPVVLLLLDVYVLRHRTTLQRRALELAPFVVLAVITALFAAVAQTEQAALSLERHPIGARLAQASYALAFYPWKTLLPLDLSPLYQLSDFSLSWSDPLFVVCAAGIALVTAVAFLLRSRREVWAAWLSYAVIVSPIIGILQSGRQITADRYAYLSILPLTWLAAAGLVRLLSGPRRRIWLGAALVSIVTLGALTIEQCGVWKDDATYWRRIVRYHPDDGFLRAGLGQALQHLDRKAEAAKEYSLAADVVPGKPDLRINAAIMWYKDGQLPEARQELAKLLAAFPSHPRGSLLMGAISSQLGANDDAVRHLRIAAAGGIHDAWIELARHWMRVADKPKARAALKKLLQLVPNHRGAQDMLAEIR